jgi:predicted GNAT superfamily acetyltransferase
MKKLTLHILETPQDMLAIEEIQRLLWPGTDRDIVPDHMLLAAVHNGGLVIGAIEIETPGEALEGPAPDELEFLDLNNPPEHAELVGFVFGFPGLYTTPDGPRLKHCSHMLGVLPAYRNQGLGFQLKRAQWQMVRHQGIDRITWTYDPLLSRNAHLNIARLGTVCNTYIREAYGEMRDTMNQGVPSDRFQVDWWVNSKRVLRRMSKRPRAQLDLAHYLAAGIPIINPTRIGGDDLPRPAEPGEIAPIAGHSLLLVEIPADFLALKTADQQLAIAWRLHTRSLFEELFQSGYLVTDSVYLPGTNPRSFYVMTYGEAEIMGINKSTQP